MSTPIPGVPSPETIAARERLKDGKPGDVVTEYEMAAVIGEPCVTGTRGAGIVYRARVFALKEYSVCWVRDADAGGWRVVEDSERIRIVRDEGAKKLRGLSRKHLRLLNVPSDGLSPEDRRDQKILQVVNGMTILAHDGRTRKQLVSSVADVAGLKSPTSQSLIALMKPDDDGSKS